MFLNQNTSVTNKNKFPEFQVFKKKINQKSKQSRKCLPSFWYLWTGKKNQIKPGEPEKFTLRRRQNLGEWIFKKYFQWFTDYKEWKLHQIKAWGVSKGSWFGLWFWWKSGGKGTFFGHVATTLRWQNPNCPRPRCWHLTAWLIACLASFPAGLFHCLEFLCHGHQTHLWGRKEEVTASLEASSDLELWLFVFYPKIHLFLSLRKRNVTFWLLLFQSQTFILGGAWTHPRPQQQVQQYLPGVNLMVNVNLVVNWSFFPEKGAREATNLKSSLSRVPWELWGQPKNWTEQSLALERTQDSRDLGGYSEISILSPKTTGAAEPSPQIYPQNPILGIKGCGSTLLHKRQSPKETQSKH